MGRCSKKKAKKKYNGKCLFCGETNYSLLDSHRIIEGGQYDWSNTLTVCASCHRRCHCGEIKVDKKYPSTYSKWVVHYFVNGQEFWKPED